MAPRIKAVNAYCPRIEQGNTVQKPELERALSRATGLVESKIAHSIKELCDQIIEFNRTGRAVKVEGLGIFSGKIVNRKNIGKQSADLVEMWNNENPEDQVELDASIQFTIEYIKPGFTLTPGFIMLPDQKLNTHKLSVTHM